ncbi:MAG: outer membrane protein assembly factor BamD [Planctomycetes bacterium]|nr:outer membrane protein assembly factor BamD [Planctomycetota bacterium]
MPPVTRLALLCGLALALPARADWAWSFENGWTERENVPPPADPSTPSEYAAAGQFSRAARGFAERKGLSVLEAKASLLQRADAHLLAGEWMEAFDDYEAYFALAATHAERARARRFQADAAILGVRKGSSLDWIGVRGTGWAEKRAADILDAYGYEEWSTPARIRLGQALLEADRPEKGIPHFEWILTEQRQSAWAPKARYFLAISWIAMHTGTVYDSAPLRNARRNLQAYLDDYPNSDDIESVHARMRDLDEKQAEKDFRTADHYRGRSRWRAARVYFKEVVRLYPLTTWADKAREILPEIEEKVSKLPKQEREK